MVQWIRANPLTNPPSTSSPFSFGNIPSVRVSLPMVPKFLAGNIPGGSGSPLKCPKERDQISGIPEILKFPKFLSSAGGNNFVPPHGPVDHPCKIPSLNNPPPIFHSAPSRPSIRRPKWTRPLAHSLSSSYLIDGARLGGSSSSS